MKKVLKVLIIVVISIVALLALLVAVAYIGTTIEDIKKGDIEFLRSSTLTEYQNSEGGDMRGGGYRIKVGAYDDTRAYVSSSQKDWHGADPVVEEYLVDKKILGDIEAVFRKYHMQRWKHKKFSKVFVYDKGSTSYYFKFGHTLSYDFSSQIFPERYSKKFDEIDKIIADYSMAKEELPKLVMKARSDDEITSHYEEMRSNGKVNLEVTEYCLGIIHYSLVNGTEDTVSVMNRKYKVFKEGVAEAVLEYSYEYANSFDKGQQFSEDTEPKWLEPGNYRLEVGENGEYVCEFEIR